jgi:hypothetical protein
MKRAKPTSALLDVRIDGARVYLRAVRRQPVSRLPGFDRKKHRVPDHRYRASADSWIKQLFEEEVRKETQALYQNAKKTLGLLRDQMERSAAEGAGSVETPAFWFSIDTGQDPGDPAQARTVRTLRLRVPPSSLPESFESLFPDGFEELVLPLEGETDFDDLVRKFETYARRVGGEVIEDEDAGRIRFLSRDGWEWVVRLPEREMVLRPNRTVGCLAMIHSVTHYFSTSFLPRPSDDSSP